MSWLLPDIMYYGHTTSTATVQNESLYQIHFNAGLNRICTKMTILQVKKKKNEATTTTRTTRV
jgi:hypothetical protein